MADTEVTVAVETPVEAPVENVMTAQDAVLEVVKASKRSFGLVKGLNQVVRSVDTQTAKVVVLAEDCDNEGYVKLVKALCTARGVTLLTTPEKLALGQAAGLCRIDEEGNAVKSVACSSVAIKAHGDCEDALKMLDLA